MKAAVAKSVIFAAFINDANIAMGSGFFIGNDAINLAHLKRSLVSLIVDTEGKLACKMCHNYPIRLRAFHGKIYPCRSRTIS